MQLVSEAIHRMARDGAMLQGLHIDTVDVASCRDMLKCEYWAV